jgi:hypothetical protein
MDILKNREANIAANEAFLKSIGFDLENPTLKLEKGSRKTKRRKSNNSDDDDDEGRSKDYTNAKEGCRKSSRLNIALRTTPLVELGPEGIIRDEGERRKPVRKALQYCDEDAEYWNYDVESCTSRAIKPTDLLNFIEKENAEHYELVSTQQVSHCTMRFNSMTTKAFSNRLKQIARHAGKNSYEKLLVAYYAVRLAGMDKVADAAAQALAHIGVYVSSI